jgi:hypothetical protein
MQTIVSVAMSAIQSIVMTAIGVLRGVWNAGWTLIMNITTTAVNVIRAVLNGLALIFQAIQSALNTLKGVWSSVWGAIAGAIGGIVGTIVGALGGIISVLSKIVSMAGAAAGALRNLAGQAAAGIPIIGPGISIIGGFLGGQKGITNVPPGSSFFAGEAGTELITLHGRGATVLTANKTAMAGNSSTGPLVGTLNVYGGQGTPAEIREAVEDALMAVVDRDRARRPH